MIGHTLGGAFDKVAAGRGDAVALEDDDRSFSYRALRDTSTRVAQALHARGLRPGDRIALWMHNRCEYVIAELAIAKLGAIRVPLNHLLDDDEVSYRLGHSGARLVICGPEFTRRAVNVAVRRREAGVRVVAIDAIDDGTEPWSALETASSDGSLPVVIAPSDRAAIMYTGGTTGRSKGVVHTHDTILATTISSILEWELTPRSVLAHVTPLPHGAGFMTYAGLLRGARNILLPKFSVEGYLETIARERVTFSFVVPTMLYLLLDSGRIGDFDVTSLETVLYGAAPMAPARVAESVDALGPVLVQAYAQMEAINQGTLLSKKDHIDALEGNPERLASCGRQGLIPSVTVVDDDGVEVGPGEVGEIVIRSPHVMREYWMDPPETAKALRDGWLHTGDLATRDAEGYLFVVDRARDVVISGGMNVYSTKVEAALFEHPSVQAAAVFAVPDPKWGEAVRAHVVLRPDHSVDVDTLLDHCRSRLARYEVPKQVELVDTLPLTPYGKLDKKALRAPFWSSAARQVG